jgi:hypothetical protein
LPFCGTIIAVAGAVKSALWFYMLMQQAAIEGVEMSPVFQELKKENEFLESRLSNLEDYQRKQGQILNDLYSRDS